MSKIKDLLDLYAKRKLLIAIIIALILSGIVVWLGYKLDQKLSTESVAIQVIQLILTTVAAIIPTRILAQRQEAEINKNRAKMALKRTVTLYNQMNMMASHIETERNFIKSETDSDNLVKESLVANALDSISAMHKIQYGVIEDIGSDWKDVIPEEFTIIDNTENINGDSL